MLIIFFVANNKTKTPNKYNVSWYDIDEDWDLILISVAKKGVYVDEMSFEKENDMYIKTFLRIVAGLEPETPLGYVVSIRSEEDPKIRKKFSDSEKRIWLEWQKRIPIEYKQAKMQEKLNKLG